MIEWTNEDEKKLAEAQKRVNRLLNKKKFAERMKKASGDTVIFASSEKSKLKSYFK